MNTNHLPHEVEARERTPAALERYNEALSRFAEFQPTGREPELDFELVEVSPDVFVTVPKKATVAA